MESRFVQFALRPDVILKTGCLPCQSLIRDVVRKPPGRLYAVFLGNAKAVFERSAMRHARQRCEEDS